MIDMHKSMCDLFREEVDEDVVVDLQGMQVGVRVFASPLIVLAAHQTGVHIPTPHNSKSRERSEGERERMNMYVCMYQVRERE